MSSIPSPNPADGAAPGLGSPTLAVVPDISELEALAGAVLTPSAYDYFRGGADDEVTVAENLSAWEAMRLRPHVLRDVSDVSTATTVLGTPVATPVLVAPCAYHELASPLGESATARGTAAAGSLFTLSTFATQTLERVEEASPGSPKWFQVYVYRDRALTEALVLRAAAAGYRALVLTADLPVLGRRKRDERNGFALPPPLVMAHFVEDTPTQLAEGSALTAHVQAKVDPALTFDDIGWLRDVSGLPVIVKGVLRADDAVECLDAGAAAVWVSNHGGRQLDAAVPTAAALPEVVEAVAGRAEVYVDGGIRSGGDVVKAMALGATAVMVGRPVVYALAVGGADGVAGVLAGLTEELARTMALCGARTLADLSADLVA